MYNYKFLRADVMILCVNVFLFTFLHFWSQT